METTKNFSIQRLGIRTGLVTSLCFICYFLLMKVTGLIVITELRALNILIMLGGFLFAYNYLKTQKRVGYLQGFGMGCWITAISVLIFALFLFIYFSQLDPQLMEQLKGKVPLIGMNFSPLTAALSVICEGTVSGLVLSFIFMQYFQNRFNTPG